VEAPLLSADADIRVTVLDVPADAPAGRHRERPRRVRQQLTDAARVPMRDTQPPGAATGRARVCRGL